jgi:osmotically inducible protein OsmC
MPTYFARFRWSRHADPDGDDNRVQTGSQALDAALALRTRPEAVTNPEEMVGAALAGSYALALAQVLTAAGCEAEAIHATAAVDLSRRDGHLRIPRITLHVEIEGSAVEAEELPHRVHQAERRCALANALAGTEVVIEAELGPAP